MSTSVSGLSTNFFPSPQNGFTTTLASSISAGATSVPLNSVAGYSNGEVAVLVIDPANSSKQTFTGVVDTSGVQLTSVVWTAGTNVAHTAGATVTDYATATHIAMISKGAKVAHNQDGTHKSGAVYTLPTITDFTNAGHTHANAAGGGQLVEGAFAQGAVGGADLSTSAIKLGYASVTSTQTVNSISYTDITNAAVTVTVPAGGRDVVILGQAHGSSSGGVGGFTLDIREGATVLQSTQTYIGNTSNAFTLQTIARVSAPGAGSHTYKLTGKLPSTTSGFYADAAGFTTYILVLLV